MNEPIIKKLEDRKSLLEQKIQDLEKQKRTYSRQVSEIQVQIIGFNGELNATKEILEEFQLSENK